VATPPPNRAWGLRADIESSEERRQPSRSQNSFTLLTNKYSNLSGSFVKSDFSGTVSARAESSRKGRFRYECTD